MTKNNFKLLFLLPLLICSSKKYSGIDKVTYTCYVEGTKHILTTKHILAKITFENDTSLLIVKKKYFLECYSHMNQYSKSAYCYYDSKIVKLYDNEFEQFVNQYTIQFKRKQYDDNKISVHIDKKLLPTWIKFNDSFFWVEKNQNIELKSTKDTSEITLISDKVKVEYTKPLSVTNGSKISIGLEKIYSNLRGDLRPSIGRIQYGFFRNDTLIFVGNMGDHYKFVRDK